MLVKFILAVVVWVVVAIVLELIGNLLNGDIGVWLQNNNVIIGFLAGLLYFFFGDSYARPVR